ncbi:family 43 glycosylhydrolase [Rathayibacter soli]|uniref:family 43 glycosylhydrolase n=1 Tax=Rathayibacter soli TaxID=3144168 RepID=UPI0027E56074|nr:family 43 glycosylhydrolase [Glaciibacter superstes]
MGIPDENDRYFADPALTVFAGRYYLYPTTDGIPGWGSTSFRVLVSDDLRNWRDGGEVLALGRDVAWASRNAWAPAASQGPDGRFYFYFSADDNIGVAVSDTPTGPFIDSGKPLIPAGRYPGRAIDPSVFTDADGSSYLVWGNTVANFVRLAPSMTAIDESTHVTWVHPSFREAAHIHRRGDLYYLTWSENDTRDPDYRIRWAVGGSPFGPWDVRGVLLEQDPERGVVGTGHHSIAQLPGTDDWVIAYHRFAVPGGDGYHRELVVQPLHHDKSGDLEPVVPDLEPLLRSTTN